MTPRASVIEHSLRYEDSNDQQKIQEDELGVDVRGPPPSLKRSGVYLLLHRHHHPVARVLPKEHIKHKISGNEKANTQKNQLLKLGNARKLCNTGNGDIDTIMQKNGEIVQAAKWTLRVHYGEVNIRGFIGQ